MFSLDNETTGSGGDEFFKDFGKVFRDLFECAFDGFIFALVEDFDEFADGFLGGFEFFATGGEGFALFGEVVELFKGFLVDAAEFLERFLHFVEPFQELQVRR